MAEEFKINFLRRAFKIPDSVLIIPFAKHNVAATNLKPNSEKFEVPEGDEVDEPIGYSALNTPVFSNIEFEGGRYETDVKGIFKSFPALKFDAVLIQVSRPKIIEETEVQGRTGTIKEYIGTADWLVQVDGVITGKNGQYPYDEVADLQKMLDAPIPVDVSCRYLQNLGIVSLVVYDQSLPQEEGSESYQTFSIVFKSDVPVELRISDSDV